MLRTTDGLTKVVSGAGGETPIVASRGVLVAFSYPLRLVSKGEEGWDIGDLRPFACLFTREILMGDGMVVEGPSFSPHFP